MTVSTAAKVDRGCKPRFRYAIVIISLLCLSSVMANIVCFNFTVLCMPGDPDTAHVNGTATGYTLTQKTWLLSAVAVGALVSVFPLSLAVSRFGIKIVFILTGLIGIATTASVPFFAVRSTTAFLVIRFLQGISMAIVFPAVGAITAQWAPSTQHGLFMSALTTFGQLSAVFAMPVAGELCTSSLGWQSVYYVHAGVSAVLFILFAIYYTNTPEQNRWVTETERSEISDGRKVEAESKHVPYISIMTTPSVWGVWIGGLGDFIAVQLIHIFSPQYLHSMMGYSLHKTGIAAALPVLLQFFVKMISGVTSDRVPGISETTKLRIFNSIALCGSGAFLIALVFVPRGASTAGLVLMIAATGMFGFNGAGFNKCASLISREHTHVVMAIIQFLYCLSMLFCPMLVQLMLTDVESASQWHLVFLVHAGILIVCNAIFCVLATAKAAPWTSASIGVASKRNTPIISTSLRTIA